MDGPYLAAVDIGGTKITVSIANISGILVKLYRAVQLEGDNLAVPAQVDFLVGHACEQIGIERDEMLDIITNMTKNIGILLDMEDTPPDGDHTEGVQNMMVDVLRRINSALEEEA